VNQEIRRIVLVAVILAAAAAMAYAAAPAKPLDQYLSEATKAQQAGDLTQAVALMEAAGKDYPENATIFANLGLYKGMQAGATQNFMEAGRLSGEAFTLLDKAIDLDSLNVTARFNRGLMGVKVPEFLGRLDGALKDLRFVIVLHDDFPGMVSESMLASTYELLGEGYQKKGDAKQAEDAWRQAMAAAPGTATAKTAERNIAALSGSAQTKPAEPQPKPEPGAGRQPVEAQPAGDTAASIAQAQADMDKGDYIGAEAILRLVVAKDSTNARVYRMLGTSIALADRGYDERITKDTTLRTNLVFEAMADLDKAVSLAPEDLEARLARGAMAVSFPFFVGKLDQGLDDLKKVADGNAPAPEKAQARYWLGFGYQKKGLSYWTSIVTDNPNEEVVRMVLQGMSPRIDHFDRSQQPGPVVVVEFVLGFRDELEPQTAVWIESDKGDFIRTIYVSGFSGHVKGTQVVLPEWAKSTKFAGADAVTGASIALGSHIYLWDLKDAAGQPVKPGKYAVKVEASYWPSMKYQLASAAIEVGKQETRQVTKEGDYVPYLEVRYLP
jgi:tetratricopeptide (TPR) repeat protein